MAKITKSIRVDEALWKEVRLQAVKEDLDISSFVESALKERIKKAK